MQPFSAQSMFCSGNFVHLIFMIGGEKLCVMEPWYFSSTCQRLPWSYVPILNQFYDHVLCAVVYCSCYRIVDNLLENVVTLSGIMSCSSFTAVFVSNHVRIIYNTSMVSNLWLITVSGSG